jgi:hypothetical protein
MSRGPNRQKRAIKAEAAMSKGLRGHITEAKQREQEE